MFAKTYIFGFFGTSGLKQTFPTLVGKDYLWGQHRIKAEQGSSGDFAKNDYNHDHDHDEVNPKIVYLKFHDNEAFGKLRKTRQQ